MRTMTGMALVIGMIASGARAADKAADYLAQALRLDPDVKDRFADYGVTI